MHIKRSYTEDTARIYDTNGYFEVKDNPISKSGVFQYLGKSIPNASEPDKVYNVYRPDEEVNNEETINSFKLIPIVDDHEMLGEHATPAEQKGMHGVSGQEVYFKDGVLYANLKIHSETLKGLLESGKRELSCGYTNDWIEESGVSPQGERYEYIQKNIRGNHIALVDKGRMGKDVAVLDSIEEKGEQMTKEELLELLKTISPDELKEVFKTETEIEVEDMKEEVKAEVEDTKSEDEKSEDEKSEDEKVKIEEKAEDMKSEDACKPKSMDADEIVARVKRELKEARTLTDKLTPFIGSFDHLDTVEEVAQYGLNKLGIKCDKGQEVATIKGYLAGAKVENKSVSMDSVEKDNSKIMAKYF